MAPVTKSVWMNDAAYGSPEASGTGIAFGLLIYVPPHHKV